MTTWGKSYMPLTQKFPQLKLLELQKIIRFSDFRNYHQETHQVSMGVSVGTLR